MHGARIDRAFGNAGRLLWRGAEVFRWLGHKLRETAAGAEIVSSAVVLVAMFRGVRVYEHSTHGVSHAALDLRGRVLAMRMAFVAGGMIMGLLGRRRSRMRGASP